VRAQETLQLAMDVYGLKSADGHFAQIHAVSKLLSDPKRYVSLMVSLIDIQSEFEASTAGARAEIDAARKRYDEAYRSLVEGFAAGEKLP